LPAAVIGAAGPEAPLAAGLAAPLPSALGAAPLVPEVGTDPLEPGEEPALLQAPTITAKATMKVDPERSFAIISP